tara:strand:- start:1956 stop:2831 length:876 start_codon:yes stop_codon:yes gene_type:complete
MEFTSNNLTFIIVTFKSRNVIFDCLNSLPKNFSKLIIENSSDQELKKEIEQNYVDTHVILSTNIGMGAGNNIGILKSKTDFVYIMNPDVKFNENTLKFLNNSIANLKDFAILSPISDNLNYPNYKVETRTNISRDEINKDLMPVSEIDGYSMIINKKYFSDKNYFDENFFMYLENVDLCLRAKKNNGKLFIAQKSKINHLGAKAVDEKFQEQIEYSRNWHWMWSKFYFNKKYKGILISLIIGLISLLINSFKYFIYLLILNKIKKKAYLMRISGLWNSIIGKTSWYRPKIN